MRTIFKIITISLLFVISIGQDCGAYDHEYTHPYINSRAVEADVSKTDSILKKSLGFLNGIESEVNGESINYWIAYGGTMEDEPERRCFNHFHDPLKDWNNAGLFSLNRSSIIWAQASDNDFSWQLAKEYYYHALLTGSEESWAKTFRALGQVMHLVSDAAVPAHVRNDAHAKVYIYDDSDPYENWVKNNEPKIEKIEYKWFSASDTIFDNAITKISAPGSISALWDHDEYLPDGSNMPDGSNRTIGLAEYTNANFWTEDTIDDYPHPSLEDTNYDEDVWRHLEPVDAEDAITDHRMYFSKTTGDPVQHFMAANYWFYQLYEWNKWEVIHSAFILDETCFEDYAEKLIPRAIGYSAALLDYFFRGSMDIKLPSHQYHSGVYAITEDASQGFTRIVLNARNTTANEEAMADGSIELVVKYKLALEDPFQSRPVPSTEAFSYIVAPEANNVRAISGDQYTELAFDLSPALPINATNITFHLVYKGILGADTDDVAVGYKDISEPTPLDVFSNLDKVCLAGGWLDAGSAEAIALIDENGNGISDYYEIDVYPHDTEDYYMRLSSVEDPQNPAGTKEDIHIAVIHAGEFLRVAYFLGDDELSFSGYSESTPCNYPNDYHTTDSHVFLKTDTLVTFRRQANRYTTCNSFRGVDMHGIWISYGGSWGHDTTCSPDDLE